MAQPLLLDDFDDGVLSTATGGVNGGFLYVDNGAGSGSAVESGGGVTITAVNGNNNSGIYSSNTLNLAGEAFFTAHYVVSQCDRPAVNGVFLGITENNVSFFRGVSNFGVVIGSSKYGSGADDIFLVANDADPADPGNVQATILEDIDFSTLADGFELTFTVRANNTYSYAISGITGTGSQTGRGSLTNIVYASQFDSADCAVVSLQAYNTPRSIVVEKMEVTPSTPFNHFMELAFVDSDGDSYSDEAESAFGTGTHNPADMPDFTDNQTKPNVVIIYADDMGFSDMSFYGRLFGTPSPANTPHMDALAASGVTFTQGHSSNAVCTPSRYALLTGKYNWREFDGISSHYGWKSDMPDLPKPGDLTIAEFLKGQGYDTAAFGKWHLGGRWYSPSGTRITDNPTDPAAVDWTRRIEGHATDIGFDFFRGLGAVINFGPYVYLHDDTVMYWDTTLDDGYNLPPLGFKTGGTTPKAGGFRPATTNDTFSYLSTAVLNSSVLGATDSRASLGDPSYRQVDAGPIMIADFESYISNRVVSADSDPFFAYVALYSPHKPWAITPEFDGISGVPGFDYADFLAEVDNRIGRIVAAIENAGYGANTMIVLTADNGPENTAMERSISYGKDSNGPLRGNKRDSWEGGTRVPFVVRWPGQAVPGMVSNELIWQGDIYATIAAYLGVDLPDTTAPDGESFLNIIRGQRKPSPRRSYIVCSSIGDRRAIISNAGWKLVDSDGSSSDSTSWDSSNVPVNSAGAVGGVPKQLYNLNSDIGEDNNLISGITDVNVIRTELIALTGTDLYAELLTLGGSFTTLTCSREPDNDADEMANSFEDSYAQLDREDPTDAGEDFEPDGLTNLQEETYGSSPIDDDSDDDGLKDGSEVFRLGTRPESAHSDGDALGDGDEVLIYGTDPLLADTDGDGVSDSDELSYFSNPRNAAQVPVFGASLETALSPSVFQVAGVNGTVTDPRDVGAWDSGVNGPGSGSLYVRERRVGGSDQQWRSRLFLKFDLSSVSNRFESARLRIHQVDRLNTSYSENLEVSRVLDDWDIGGFNYPLFAGTAVADAFDFGNNGDFGTAIDASGFYSGIPGVAGTDDSGFDPDGNISDIVGGWYSGSYSNYGFRIAFSAQDFVGAAFASVDDPATPGTNENLQLLVVTRELPVGFDSDGDNLPDSFEMEKAGNLDDIDGMRDDDGDGFSNAIELALGSSMTDTDSRPLVGITVIAGSTVEIDQLRVKTGGAGYLVECSTNLVDWVPGLESLLNIKRVVDDTNGYERVTYEMPVDDYDTLFFSVTPVFP